MALALFDLPNLIGCSYCALRRSGTPRFLTAIQKASSTHSRARPRAQVTLRAVADDAVAVMEQTGQAAKQSKAAGPLPYGVSIEQGPRETMEDYATVVQNAQCGFLYAGVFDGHQGPGAAEYLHAKLYNALAGVIQTASETEQGSATDREGRPALTVFPGGASEESKDTGMFCPVQLQQVLETTFQDMDREVLQHLAGQQVHEDRLAGSTATVVLARRDLLVCANVGDSRAVLSRGGKAIHMSSEHRVTGQGKGVQGEIERVEGTGAWVSDGRVCDILAVSRAFGDTEFKGEGLKELLASGVESEWWDQKFADSVKFTSDPVVALPDVTELEGHDDDEFVILATDGLWDVMKSNEVVTFAKNQFRKGRSAQEVADTLTTTAIRRHTVDNVSVIVVDLGGGKTGWPDARELKGKNPFARLFNK